MPDQTTPIDRTLALWHYGLTGRRPIGLDLEGARERPGDPGAFVQLRRCADMRDVLMTAAFGQLVAAVHPAAAMQGAASLPEWDIAALAATALVLSEVGCCRRAPPDGGRIPRLMATAPEGRAMPRVPPLRAATLFASRDAAAACSYLRGLMPLVLDGVDGVEPGHVYLAMRAWPEARRKWAMDYHAITAAVAQATTNASP